MRVILASASPRRREILRENNVKFEIVESDFNERKSMLCPVELCKFNALGKAKCVFEKLNNKDVLVIGADTIVVYNDEILGKPKDKEDAFIILEKLSGNTHAVYTGYAVLYKDAVINGYDKSLVTFENLSPKLIESYIQSGKPMDKAGAYGIQDEYKIVKSYSGSLKNIIGLPIEKIFDDLKRNGIELN